MNAINFEYTCENCSTKFLAPGISDFSYGSFIMRTRTDEDIVYVDALNDKAFSDCYEIVKANSSISKNTEIQATIQQSVFSLTCEKSPHGGVYEIGLLHPVCPHCKSRNMKSWRPSLPIQSLTLELVNHSSWNSLSMESQIALINEGIHTYLMTKN